MVDVDGRLVVVLLMPTDLKAAPIFAYRDSRGAFVRRRPPVTVLLTLFNGGADSVEGALCALPLRVSVASLRRIPATLGLLPSALRFE